MPGISDPLTRRAWIGLGAYLLLIVAYAGVTEIRSCFLSNPMTDAQCYFRAAWAVRTGADPYQVTDDNGWHYNYPPLTAILAWPFADAPKGHDRAGLLPFAVSVPIWYCLSTLALFWGVHTLATALEEWTGTSVMRYGRRWWRLRAIAVIGLTGPIGLTLNRGQVNLFVLATLCAALAALLRKQSGRAGAWLSLAICVKVIPAYLLILPVVRRDWRMLLGAAGGLVVGLGLVPLIVLGPERTADCYRTHLGVLLHSINDKGDASRARELTNLTVTDSVAIPHVLHNTLYFGVPPEIKPQRPSPAERTIHLAAFGGLTAVTALALWRRRHAADATVIGFCLFVLVMLMNSPVSHQHYFCWPLPFFMILLARQFAATDSSEPAWKLWLMVFGFGIAAGCAYLPGCEFLIRLGSVLYATMIVWAVGVMTLWRLPVAHSPASIEPIRTAA